MFRSMNPAESLLAKVAHTHNGGWRVATLVSVRGTSVTKKQLSEVLLLMQARHPLLRTRICFSKSGKPSWKEDESLRIPVEIPSGVNPMQAYLMANRKPLKDGDGVFQILIVKGDASSHDSFNESDKKVETTTLVFMCEHFACDGMSFNWVIHEILLGLSNKDEIEKLPLLPFPESIVEMGRKLSNSIAADTTRYMKFFYHYSRSALKFGRHFPISLEMSELESSQTCNQIHLAETLSTKDTKALLSKCRDNETTITGAIASALSDSFSEILQSKAESGIQQSETVGVHLAVDGRRHYKPMMEKDHLSFQVTGTIPQPLIASGKTNKDELWTNAHIFKCGLTSSMSRGDHVSIMQIYSKLPVLEKIGRFVKGIVRTVNPQQTTLHRSSNENTNKNLPQIFFTNWGKLPFLKQYGNLEVVDATPGINSLTMPFPVVIASSFDKRVKITVLGPEPSLSKEDLEMFFEGVISRLSVMADDEI